MHNLNFSVGQYWGFGEKYCTKFGKKRVGRDGKRMEGCCMYAYWIYVCVCVYIYIYIYICLYHPYIVYMTDMTEGGLGKCVFWLNIHQFLSVWRIIPVSKRLGFGSPPWKNHVGHLEGVGNPILRGQQPTMLINPLQVMGWSSKCWSQNCHVKPDC